MPRRDKKREVKICGQNACLALFDRRPADIVRVYLTEARIPVLKPVLEHCVQHRLAYHVVDKDELDRVAESQHHEGVCILARRRELRLEDLFTEGPQLVLAVDRVGNPHNLGAILRAAAHFGVRAVLLEAPTRLSPAAYRIAEGGAEHVAVVPVNSLKDAARRLKENGHEVVATSGRGKRTVYGHRFSGRCLVLLGSEREGLSDALAREADAVVAIPGTGHVESLNVSAAAAVVLSEVFRQTRDRRPRGPRR